MVPRVLVVQAGPDLDEAEPVVAGDGETALEILRRERFDAVVVDLGLAPIDGWCVLAAVGSWAARPRLVALVADPAHAGRAAELGADLCVAAGTLLDARALTSSMPQSAQPMLEETKWPQPRTISFRRPTPSGASA